MSVTDLDFSGLNSIATESAQEAFSEPFGSEGIHPTPETEKPTETAQEAPRGQAVEGLAKVRLLREQEDHKKTLELYRSYQTNIRRSGQLRTDIIKGVRAGEAPLALLLKAVECVACMTGERSFYEQVEADLKAVWGEGFLYRLPLEWELGEVEDRIANMESAVKRGSTGNSRERIERALGEHYQRREELKALLDKGKKEDLETMRAGA